MYIARLSLICLVAFAFMVGCGMMGQKAEMSETAATSTMDSAPMKSDAKSASDVAEAMDEAAVEEITLNVTGMT
jgi:hypothetical protein